ncbi:NAC domain-containing protein 68 [Triticum aestivum]|uniref:NAC domain-containing protein 68 n=1 Tax=Triticum aestivum TaxID=4565 RepID=UPI001D012B3C|nr:NAC domain-containing protein 68-like [Triticum aestivum]
MASPEPQPQPAASEAPFARPPDRDLLDHLRRWMEGGAETLPSWISVAQVYDLAPSDLMAPDAATTAADGSRFWYFVTKLRHRGPHDPRISRTAGGGTWKLEHDIPLASDPGAVLPGIKRSLSFTVKDEHGIPARTGHLMLELLLAEGAGLVPGGELAICELYHTKRGDDMAVTKALEKARQKMQMLEQKKMAKTRAQQVRAAAKTAKEREMLAAREANRNSKAKHRAALKAAAAAAIGAFNAPAPPSAASTTTATSASTTHVIAVAPAHPLTTAPLPTMTAAAGPTDAVLSTAGASATPKRVLLLHVGVDDHVVYDAHVVEDGPPFKKLKAIDFIGWVLLDPRTKDCMTGRPCATV